MDTKAIFPGSFDPLTVGHVEIIYRSLNIFDQVIIAVGNNAAKQTMFSLEQRMEWINNTFKGNGRIKVMSYEKLTVDFCSKVNADTIIRGLRNGIDFEYEAAISRMNRDLVPEIDTICFVCSPSHVAISSTIVRDIIRNGGDASEWLAKGVKI